jgi:hypothetical protein
LDLSSYFTLVPPIVGVVTLLLFAKRNIIRVDSLPVSYPGTPDLGHGGGNVNLSPSGSSKDLSRSDSGSDLSSSGSGSDCAQMHPAPMPPAPNDTAYRLLQ